MEATSNQIRFWLSSKVVDFGPSKRITQIDVARMGTISAGEYYKWRMKNTGEEIKIKMNNEEYKRRMKNQDEEWRTKMMDEESRWRIKNTDKKMKNTDEE